MKQSPRRRFFLGDTLNFPEIGNFMNFFYDQLIVRRYDLPAVRPIHFITVVLGGIMACRDHDSRGCLARAHRKRQFGRRAQPVEQEHLNPVRAEDQRRIERKFRRHFSAVIRDRNRGGGRRIRRRTRLDCFRQVIAVSLCRFCYRVDIHPVRPRTDHAAQSPSTKFQFTVKTIMDLFLVPAYTLQFL